MLDLYFQWIMTVMLEYGYVVIFFGLFLEVTFIVGLFFPGLFILILAGFLVAEGSLGLTEVWLVSYVAVVSGDLFGYFLGYRGLIKLSALRRFSDQYEKAEKALRSNTERFLFVFHFPAFSRMLVPPLLGLFRFPLRRFALIDSIGAALFVFVFSGIGYLVGLAAESLEQAISISRILQGVFLLALAWWLFEVFKSFRRVSRRDGDEASQ